MIALTRRLRRAKVKANCLAAEGTSADVPAASPCGRGWLLGILVPSVSFDSDGGLVAVRTSETELPAAAVNGRRVSLR